METTVPRLPVQLIVAVQGYGTVISILLSILLYCTTSSMWTNGLHVPVLATIDSRGNIVQLLVTRTY